MIALGREQKTRERKSAGRQPRDRDRPTRSTRSRRQTYKQFVCCQHTSTLRGSTSVRRTLSGESSFCTDAELKLFSIIILCCDNSSHFLCKGNQLLIISRLVHTAVAAPCFIVYINVERGRGGWDVMVRMGNDEWQHALR
jgi:hypothetical protein